MGYGNTKVQLIAPLLQERGKGVRHNVKWKPLAFMEPFGGLSGYSTTIPGITLTGPLDAVRIFQSP